MKIVDVYFDVMDKIKEEQSGSLSIASYNRKSKIGELTLLDYLTGDVEGVKPPEPWDTQKVKDWASHFISVHKGIVTDGTFAKPDDYYLFEGLAIIGSYRDQDCGDEVIRAGCDTPISLLDTTAYDQRCTSYIKRLQPNIKKPIARIIGTNFEFNPSELGSVKLIYKRYPVFGEVKVKLDPVYNNEVPDQVNSIDYEWPEFARRLLVWFISRQYATGNRENALTEQLTNEQKSERG